MPKIQPPNKNALIHLIANSIYDFDKKDFNYNADLNFIDTSLVYDFSYLFSHHYIFRIEKINGEDKLVFAYDKENYIYTKSKFQLFERKEELSTTVEEELISMDLSLFEGDFRHWDYSSAVYMHAFLMNNQAFNTHDLILDLPSCISMDDFLMDNKVFNKKIKINSSKVSLITRFLFKSFFNNDLKLNLPNLRNANRAFAHSRFNKHDLDLNFPNLEFADNMFESALFSKNINLNAPILKSVRNMFANNKHYNREFVFNSTELIDISYCFYKSTISNKITFNSLKINNAFGAFKNAINLESHHVSHNSFPNLNKNYREMAIGSKISIFDLDMPHFKDLFNKKNKNGLISKLAKKSILNYLFIRNPVLLEEPKLSFTNRSIAGLNVILDQDRLRNNIVNNYLNSLIPIIDNEELFYTSEDQIKGEIMLIEHLKDIGFLRDLESDNSNANSLIHVYFYHDPILKEKYDSIFESSLLFEKLVEIYYRMPEINQEYYRELFSDEVINRNKTLFSKASKKVSEKLGLEKLPILNKPNLKI